MVLLVISSHPMHMENPLTVYKSEHPRRRPKESSIPSLLAWITASMAIRRIRSHLALVNQNCVASSWLSRMRLSCKQRVLTISPTLTTLRKIIIKLARSQRVYRGSKTRVDVPVSTEWWGRAHKARSVSRLWGSQTLFSRCPFLCAKIRWTWRDLTSNSKS